jgi:hypothetical protein
LVKTLRSVELNLDEEDEGEEAVDSTSRRLDSSPSSSSSSSSPRSLGLGEDGASASLIIGAPIILGTPRANLEASGGSDAAGTEEVMESLPASEAGAAGGGGEAGDRGTGTGLRRRLVHHAALGDASREVTSI